MKSLLFLIRKTAKNKLLQLRRKPALLIVYVLFIGFMVFSLVPMFNSQPITSELQDIGWLKLIFLGYTLLFLFSGIYAGVSTGGSLFSMADANFLFGAPVGPKKILGYGILNQAVKSLFASVFILFTGNMLHSTWGIQPGQLAVLFLGYVLMLLISQLVSICLYMIVGGRPQRKKVVGIVCVLLVVPVIVSVLIPYLQGVPIAQAVLQAMDSNILLTLPLAGWTTQGAFALLAGDIGIAAIAGGLNIALVVVSVIWIVAGKADYYEDVLVATETAFQRQQAAKEGNMNAMETHRNIKNTGKDGIWGMGASAFLGKHIKENMRRNALKIFDATSISFIVTAVVMAFFLRGEGSLLVVLPTTMLMRVFLVGTGLGLKELYSHYIFMVPASSFSKLVWSNLEMAVKSLAESVVAFVVAGILVQAAPLEIFLSILVTSMFTLLLVAINLFSMRIFTSIISQGLLLTLYFLFVIVIMVPGVVGGVLLAMLVGGALAMPVALATILLWEVLMSLLFFFLSRGVLDTCDIETMPQSTRG